MIDIELRAELEDLQTRFIYAADRRDYDEIRRLYHPDAIDDRGSFKGTVGSYIEWVKKVQETFVMSSHVLTNMRFAREGDYAESEVRGTTYLTMKASKPFNMVFVGRHFDQYQRRDNGEWLFSDRSLCADWVQLFEPSDATIDLVGPIQRGTMDRDDPFYSRLKLLSSSVDARGSGKP